MITPDLFGIIRRATTTSGTWAAPNRLVQNIAPGGDPGARRSKR
jgi:hypothetical protein